MATSNLWGDASDARSFTTESPILKDLTPTSRSIALVARGAWGRQEMLRRQSVVITLTDLLNVLVHAA